MADTGWVYAREGTVRTNSKDSGVTTTNVERIIDPNPENYSVVVLQSDDDHTGAFVETASKWVSFDLLDPENYPSNATLLGIECEVMASWLEDDTEQLQGDDTDVQFLDFYVADAKVYRAPFNPSPDFTNVPVGSGIIPFQVDPGGIMVGGQASGPTETITLGGPTELFEVAPGTLLKDFMEDRRWETDQYVNGVPINSHGFYRFLAANGRPHRAIGVRFGRMRFKFYFEAASNIDMESTGGISVQLDPSTVLSKVQDFEDSQAWMWFGADLEVGYILGMPIVMTSDGSSNADDGVSVDISADVSVGGQVIDGSANVSFTVYPIAYELIHEVAAYAEVNFSYFVNITGELTIIRPIYSTTPWWEDSVEIRLIEDPFWGAVRSLSTEYNPAWLEVRSWGYPFDAERLFNAYVLVEVYPDGDIVLDADWAFKCELAVEVDISPEGLGNGKPLIIVQDFEAEVDFAVEIEGDTTLLNQTINIYASDTLIEVDMVYLAFGTFEPNNSDDREIIVYNPDREMIVPADGRSMNAVCQQRFK